MNRMHQLAVTLRHDLAYPAAEPVTVGHTVGHVVMVMDPQHAGVLAKILARFEAIGVDQGWIVDDGWDPDTWFHTMVDLLAEKAMVESGIEPALTLVGDAR